jgi:AbrB family looped-hinge helix DNA binding protein
MYICTFDIIPNDAYYGFEILGYVMNTMEATLAERGQIVIPKEARDALGLKPGAKLQIRVVDGRLVIEKKVALDLSRWVGSAIDDGLTTNEALTDLRGRPVPWQGQDIKA